MLGGRLAERNALLIMMAYRTRPALPNVTDDRAVIAPCPCGMAMIFQSDRQPVEKFILARAV